MPEREYGIPVIFDVTAESREMAGVSLVKMLAGHNIPGSHLMAGEGHAEIESWWTLEGVDKSFDRNDNDSGTVLFSRDLDYLLHLLQSAEDDDILDYDQHNRLIRFLSPNARVAWGPTSEGA